jgi:hypothetical protein
MQALWTSLDAQTQMLIIAALAGSLSNVLQWLQTKWGLIPWVDADSPATRKRLVQIVTVVVLASVAGKWLQSDTVQVAQIIVGALGVNQALFAAARGLAVRTKPKPTAEETYAEEDPDSA